MRALVTGASSLPGYRITLELLKKGFNVTAIYFQHDIQLEDRGLRKIRVDIRDTESLVKILDEEKPEVIIHASALGDLDLCERDKNLCWDVNVKPSIAIASRASKRSPFLLYLSTDYVFDGERGGYREHDPPNPVNYYAFTKLCGEIAFISSGAPSSVVRASSIYGFGPGRTNFAKYLFENLSRGRPVKALIDQYTTPTQATLLARAVAEIIERRLTGVFHITGEKMSRYEFALKVAEALRLNKSLIERAEMRDMNWLAKRPRDSSLDSTLTRSILRTDFYSNGEAFNILKKELEELGKT